MVTAWSAASYRRIAGAIDQPQIGLVGSGWRGRYIMRKFLEAAPGTRVVSVCDIWGEQARKAQAEADGARGFGDYRELLAFGQIDALIVATPDHWHAEPAVAALEAGLDLYIEKPLTWRREEGFEILRAARANGRICQVGTQQRSGVHYERARDEFVQGGKLGKVVHCRTWWHGNDYFLRRAPESMRRKPADLDWNGFLGRVRWREWDPQQYWSWRSYLDFGGGQITDLFTHWVDAVHMLTGRNLPLSATASGGVFHFKDGRTAPDTIHVCLEYPEEFTVTFEGVLAPGLTRGAVELFGTEGRIWINRDRCEYVPAAKGAKPVVLESPGDHDLSRRHVENFLECMKTRRQPRCDVLEGHRSAQAAHLGNLAYLQDRKIRFDTEREEVLPA